MQMFFFILFAVSALAGGTVPESTIARLKTLYPSQTDAFVRERVAVALTAEEKWTAFPPYFYELLNRSKDIVGTSLESRRGFCAGDAHFENFGYIFSDRPVFSLNDLDDSTPCLLDSDAMRLFIGHKLLGKFSADEWMKSYDRGLKHSDFDLPDALKDLQKKSSDGGRALSKKLEKILTSRRCDGEYEFLTSSEQALLQSQESFLFACSRTKIKGGSAGQKRFLVFTSDKTAIEYKPLVRPAPMYDQMVTNSQRQGIFSNAVRFFMGADFAKDYFPVSFGGVLYQRRPVLAGNQPVDYDSLSSRDLTEVMMYEAYTLGKYHSVTTARSLSIEADRFDEMAKAILLKWKSEFAE